MDYPRGACAAERRQKLGGIYKIARQESHSSHLDDQRSFMVGWGRVLPPTLHTVDTGLVGAGVKLAESVIKEAGIKLEKTKLLKAPAGGTLKIVPSSASTFLRNIKENVRVFLMTRSRGNHVRLPPRGHGVTISSPTRSPLTFRTADFPAIEAERVRKFGCRNVLGAVFDQCDSR
jgi:hypothetical protein